MSNKNTINEEMDAIDEQQKQIARLADPLYRDVVHRRVEEDLAAEYQDKCKQARADSGRVAEIAAVALNPTLRESDAEFSERLGKRRALREQNERDARKIAEAAVAGLK